MQIFHSKSARKCINDYCMNKLIAVAVRLIRNILITDQIVALWKSQNESINVDFPIIR